MGFEPFKITVSGEPSVWIGSGEKAWKESVFSSCQQCVDPATVPIKRDCTVELDFYVSRLRLYQLDLDNLLKPAIDALGTAIFSRGRTGRPFDSEDVWIRRIVAQEAF